MSEQAEINFDLEPVVILVTIAGKKYRLHEASGGAVCAFRNAMFANTKLSPEGKPETFGTMADADPVLVSKCLYEILPDGKSEGPVHVNQIRAWPNAILRKLSAKVKEISDLGDEETVEVLEKRIADDTAKLERLRAAAANPTGNGDPKVPAPNSPSTSNAPAAMTPGSG